MVEVNKPCSPVKKAQKQVKMAFDTCPKEKNLGIIHSIAAQKHFFNPKG